MGFVGLWNGVRFLVGVSVKLDFVDDVSYLVGFDGYFNRGKVDMKKIVFF